MASSPINSSHRVPAGGPATINGVLYQLLWSLLRASKAHIVDISPSPDGELEKTTLTLEPIGGGGDLVVGTVSGRIVEQVKTRRNGGSWSLRVIIADVIPDLYLACSDEISETEYRFVTEGRMGRWQEVYGFFQSLLTYGPLNDGPIPTLDHVTPLRFGGTLGIQPSKDEAVESFWERSVYTQATLFEEVVAVVRKRPAASNEPVEVTRRRLWRLLSRFKFVGEQGVLGIQKQIDACLLALVDHHEQIPEIRDALALDLGRKSTQGGATIDSIEFFREHGLDTVPLSNWPLFRAHAEQYVDDFLAYHGYDPNLDVRTEGAVDQIRDWPVTRSILMVSGESGQGKSWMASGLALAARSLPSATVIIDAAGEADATLNRISRVLWQEIGNHDAQISLSQIARRVRKVSGTGHDIFADAPWLVLVIDGVQEPEEARQLVRQQWEKLGVRVALVCSTHAASLATRESPTRIVPVSVSDFRVQELHDYLNRVIGSDWSSIPDYIREPLRRPLLARIFCEIAKGAHLQSSNEYELYQALWDRLSESDPFDANALKRIGETLLEGSSYPLSVDQLEDASVDQERLRRLERLGWLRTVAVSPDPKFDISHDRLLNWLVAVVLVDRLRAHRESPDVIAERLRAYLSHQSSVGGRGMGFVPMDVLWLMLRDSEMRGNVVDVLDGLNNHPIRGDMLYKKLIPTLGSGVVDVLLDQLKLHVGSRKPAKLIAISIGLIGGEKAAGAARQLLAGSEPMLQRAGIWILTKAPIADVLDHLWRLHLALNLDPTPFLGEHESKSRVLEESFKALSRCFALNSTWLEEKIADTTPGDPAAETLTRLLAGIGGPEGQSLWLRNKQALFVKVAPNTQRCLADCIDTYFDHSETHWLIEALSSEDDLVCSRALSALARLNPDLAIENLNRSPRRLLSLTRDWYGDRLFAVRKSKMQSKLLEMMREEGLSAGIASVYAGRESLIDAETLGFLIGSLESCVEAYIGKSGQAVHEPRIFSLLQVFASLGTIEQLAVFTERRGSRLASILKELLERIGPRLGPYQDSHLRDPALSVLRRIGGEEYTAIVNRFLSAGSQNARLEAIHHSAGSRDSETIKLLRKITLSNIGWNGEVDGFMLEQHAAAAVLAEFGEWEPVLDLVSRIGLQTSDDITDLPWYGLRPPADLLEPYRRRVAESFLQAAPGDALVLGIGGVQGDASVLHGLLERVAPDSEIARACVIGLDLLDDQSEQAVALLARVLPCHEFLATNALISNGTLAAINALWTHHKLKFNVAVLINILNKLPHSERIVDEVKELLTPARLDTGSLDFVQSLELLLSRIKSERIVSLLLNDGPLREYVRRESFADEGNCWSVGVKAASIRVLSRFDRDAAFVAARTALQNPEWHDRDHYPYLLVDISFADAVPELLRQLSVEKDIGVASAIGRAMMCDEIDEHLLAHFMSEDGQFRRAACIAAGWASRTETTEQRLVTLVGEADEEVADAAAAALCQLQRRRECRKLTESIVATSEPQERWRLLDGLLAICDPGDVHQPWPKEGAPIGEVLSPLQIRYVTAKLKQHRENLKRYQKL